MRRGERNDGKKYKDQKGRKRENDDGESWRERERERELSELLFRSHFVPELIIFLSPFFPPYRYFFATFSPSSSCCLFLSLSCPRGRNDERKKKCRERKRGRERESLKKGCNHGNEM